ncbi:hypothetical protein AVEN_138191-1 [Araneus ventricosus]|uniref:Uncharacterized protein n=1 Tax=Araneus ventricosus TaxID=182803 RepID=A0A4Y2VZ97_ARAVE|nr:hypothetical protein AVEN_138191-1 [Araneus ventricosus]
MGKSRYSLEPQHIFTAKVSASGLGDSSEDLLYMGPVAWKLVTFYTEREREDRALRRKMLIASKKRLLAVHENQRDEIVKNIVYKTPVPSLDELKRRIVTAIQNVTPQMLENT